MKKLTGADVRYLRKAHRCPDCRSEVDVNRRTGNVQVHHDDTCPMYARLKRARQTSSLLLIREDGQSDEDFAREVTTAVDELARRTGAAFRLRTDPYRGLPA